MLDLRGNMQLHLIILCEMQGGQIMQSDRLCRNNTFSCKSNYPVKICQVKLFCIVPQIKMFAPCGYSSTIVYDGG